MMMKNFKVCCLTLQGCLYLSEALISNAVIILCKIHSLWLLEEFKGELDRAFFRLASLYVYIINMLAIVRFHQKCSLSVGDLCLNDHVVFRHIFVHVCQLIVFNGHDLILFNLFCLLLFSNIFTIQKTPMTYLYCKLYQCFADKSNVMCR